MRRLRFRPRTLVLVALGTGLAALVASNLATPEKKVERRIAHSENRDDAQFRREMSVMLGPSLVRGNRVQDLQNGVEIFPAMLRAIREARHTINFETYIYWSGDIGRELAEALVERSKAGVTVNVLIDWVGSLKMEDKLLSLMKDGGVNLHRYRPLHWYNLGRLNNRTHRKLLIVDGTVGFTGGVGIADQWTGNANDPDHWRDVHFRVEGPVVAQFQAAFNDNWIKTTGKVLNGPAYFPALEPAGESDAHLFLSSPAGGSESMHLMYLMAIAAARERIDLAASYFVPDELIIEALMAARKRGVSVRVLLPGDHIDTELVRSASRALWGDLLAAGVEIHEYVPTMMHSKALIIDDTMVSVGSTNFDIRSFQLNDEASMNVYDEAFAQRMRAVFEADLKHARPYTLQQWRDRPLRERFMEAVVAPLRSQL